MNHSFDFSAFKNLDRLLFFFLGSSCSGASRLIRQQELNKPEVAQLLENSFTPLVGDVAELPQLAAMLRCLSITATGADALPLIAVALPDGCPFYVSSGRLPESGLAALLKSILLLWKNNPSALHKAAEDLCSVVCVPSKSLNTITEADLQAACRQLSDSYDSEYPGFGSSIRFPSAHMLSFLLTRASQTGEKKLRAMADGILKQMYYGGIYDRFSGGFFRCADREWFLPLFEKPLAGNAALVLSYTEAWRNGHLPLYRTVAEDSLDFILRELKAPNGLYYAGCFCGHTGEATVLTYQEVLSVLGDEHGRHFCECYDITEEGNNGAGANIPNLLLNNRRDLLPEGYADFNEQLRLFREKRSLPKLDKHTPVLGNTMLLSALSRAAALFGDRRYLNEAEELATSISSQLVVGTKVLSCPSSEEADLAAYSSTCLSLLDLYSADYNPNHILQAIQLAEALILRFSAPDGSYYSTTDSMPLRTRELFDTALPSACGMTAQLFSRLYTLTNDGCWKTRCFSLMNVISSELGTYPAGCTSALTAAVELLHPAGTVICTTPEVTAPEFLHRVAFAQPRCSSVLLKTPQTSEALARAVPYTASLTIGSSPAFYMNQNGATTGPF